MKSLAEFLDYREFLLEFYRTKKSIQPSFSYRALALRLGMDVSQVHQILKGREHLPLKAIPKFQEILELRGSQAEYFDLLVRYGRAKGEEEKRSLLAKLFAHRGARGRKLAHEEFAAFSQWYGPVVRALASQPGFSPDPMWISTRLLPTVGPERVQESLDLLVKLGFIRRTEQGGWEASDPHLTTGLGFRSEAIRHYQKQVLKIAADAIGTIPREARDITTLVISVDQAGLAEIVEMIRDLRGRIQRRVDACPSTDRIVQLAFAAFPVAKTRRAP